MKEIELLFKETTGKGFDTRKKLNRSENEIPVRIVKDIEAGNFTTEHIQELSKTFPIYYYQTCITIHGVWPEILRSSIGNYKNITQCKNGAVELRYTAIDHEKIKTIAEYLRATKSNFRLYSNSRGYSFGYAKEINNTTFQEVRAEMEPIAKRIVNTNIYGYVSLYVGADFFRKYLVLDVHPLAIPINELLNLVTAITGLTEQELNNSLQEYKEEKRREELSRAEQTRAFIERERQGKEERNIKIKELVSVLDAKYPKCSDITRGIIVCAEFIPAQNKVMYKYYKMDSKGAFGRIKYSIGFSDELISPELVNFKQAIQAKANEIRTANCYMLKPF